ncbi:MAG TPA: hypothetical protein VE504_03715 [Nitrososphaeraceae archaeon]|nr:hypothetical protein [Nitrososphaeraceae archaeon]
MKDCNIVALITLSLFISAAFYSSGDSYSQLYNPHGVKILSPAKEQEVPVSINNFKVEGVSTDNATNNCNVSLLLNGNTPYLDASSKGQNGSNDFSTWDLIFNPRLHLNVGENKLTAKLVCSDDNSNQISKYHSVNFTGTNETISVPIAKELNSPSTRDAISPTDPAEAVQNESTPSRLDDLTEVTSSDQVVRNITLGPVIIPPSESQESSMFGSSAVNDSVIIPNANNSVSTPDNESSPTVIIPPSESQESSPSPFASLNNQPHNQSNQLSNEVTEKPESRGEENYGTPLILPTPSPRVTFDRDRDDSAPDGPVEDSSPVIVVENNNTQIEEGSLLLLDAAQSYSDNGAIISNSWKQLTSHPLEYIEGLDMPILKFRAPNVSLATPLEFEVSVTDAHGKSSSGVVHILVKDVTSLGSRANASSTILNHTVLSQYTGGMQNNVKIPDSSRSNFSGPGVPNATTTQSKDLTQSTVVPTSSSIREVNDTSMSTTAGVDQIVNEGMEVILNGDSTSINGSQLSYEWRQIGGDVKVSLGQQNAKQTSFRAPEVNEDSRLTFRFIATADGVQTSSDEVNITINDVLQNPEKNESQETSDDDNDEDNVDDDDD